MIILYFTLWLFLQAPGPLNKPVVQPQTSGELQLELRVDCGGTEFSFRHKLNAANPGRITCSVNAIPEFQYIWQLGGPQSARYLAKMNNISILAAEPGKYWVHVVASDGRLISSGFQKFEVKKSTK